MLATPRSAGTGVSVTNVPRTVKATVLLILLVVAAGCGAEVRVPSPTPTGVLLTVETRGGLCADGPCGSTLFVERDGRVHEAAKPPNDVGVVPPTELAALGDAIRTTDFAQLRSHPFTGTCPTAYDGQELVFEFGAPAGIERIATCETEWCGARNGGQ